VFQHEWCDIRQQPLLSAKAVSFRWWQGVVISQKEWCNIERLSFAAAKARLVFSRDIIIRHRRVEQIQSPQEEQTPKEHLTNRTV